MNRAEIKEIYVDGFGFAKLIKGKAKDMDRYVCSVIDGEKDYMIFELGDELVAIQD